MCNICPKAIYGYIELYSRYDTQSLAYNKYYARSDGNVTIVDIYKL